MMSQLDRVIKRFSIYKVTQILLFPFLTGFLFDLRWANQVCISLCLVIFVHYVGNFLETLVLIWQSCALSALCLLMLNLVFKQSLNYSIAALSVVLVCCLLIFVIRYSKPKAKSAENIPFNFYTVAVFIYCYHIAPRGRYQNIGFLYHEDNGKPLAELFNFTKTESLSIDLLNKYDREQVSYFVRFILNFIDHLSSRSGATAAMGALNSLSNSWIFVLLSSALFVGGLISWFIENLKLNQVASYLTLMFSLALSIWSFQVSHTAGYFPLFLLNTVVVLFLFSHKDSQCLVINSRSLSFLIGVSTSLAMIGSWQPWFPVGVSAALLSVYKFSGRLYWTKSPIRRNTLLIILAIGGIKIGLSIPKILTSLDLESPGRDSVASELFYLFGMILLMGIVGVVRHSLNKTSNFKSAPTHSMGLIWLYRAVPIALVISVLLLNLSRNQKETVYFVLIFGLIFNRTSVCKIQNELRSFISNERYDASLLLCAITFTYVLVIHMLSRYIGPVYQPMYAANKSAVAFYSQFSWLLIVVVALIVFEKENRLQIGYSLVVLFAAFEILVSSISLGRSPTQGQWWHKTVVDSLSQHPELPVTCTNLSFNDVDHQTYVCNRLLDSIEDERFVEILRYQQTSMEGPRPYDLSDARKYLEQESSFKQLLIVSRAQLSPEMRDFFSGIATRRLIFLTAQAE